MREIDFCFYGSYYLLIYFKLLNHLEVLKATSYYEQEPSLYRPEEYFFLWKRNHFVYHHRHLLRVVYITLVQMILNFAYQIQ